MNKTSPEYAAWLERYGTSAPSELARLASEARSWTDAPVISLIMPVFNPRPSFLQAALDSVLAQCYPHWQLCIADDASTDPCVKDMLKEYAARDARIEVCWREVNGGICLASNTALEKCSGTLTGFLDHDDTLEPDALFHVAADLRAHPDLAFLYTDMDHLDAEGNRYDPYFKSAWNEELLLAQNYLCHLAVYRTELLREVGGLRQGFEGSQDHDLALRCAARCQAGQIRHIPRILYHWRHFDGSETVSDSQRERCDAARRQCVRDYLDTRKISAEISPGVWGFNRVEYAVPPSQPAVTCIVPARNHAEKTRVCLESVLRRSTYPNVDIILVDNGSTEEDARSLCREYAGHPRVEVIHWDRPFNFSEINNMAAARARGDFLVLLNNDTEVVSPNWVEILLGYAAQAHVGAVGPKLLYPDDTIQHAGIVMLGTGHIAREAFKRRAGDSDEYFALAQTARWVTSVTGACLMVEKRKFEEVGGLEERLAVTFNDVDFCCKLHEAGYRNIYTPYAVLRHYEFTSRGAVEDTPEKQQRAHLENVYMRERWRMLDNDPFYSIHFSRTDDTYKIILPEEEYIFPWESRNG